MANKTLFKSLIGRLVPATDAINEERAPAYALSPKHQLAQYAATGCLNTTFYAGADEQLAKVLDLCADIDGEFIAKTAVFCRERGFMKDMPALLCAVLSVNDRDQLNAVFPRVIDNAKMLRNFVQIMRSGAVGRKSLGSAPKRLVREWLDARDPAMLFKANVGQDPSLTDIVKMVHHDPKAIAKARVFPYQLMVAYTMANANADIPKEVCDALQDAMEIAIANVPTIEGRVFVCPDVSGSMSSPVTGYRKGATTAVRCID